MGLDFDRRGERIDEAIAVCRRLWSEDVVEHHGQHFDFGPVAFEPKPVQRPFISLQIGGDGPAALRRAATVGTGWMPMNHTLEDLPRAVARLRSIRNETPSRTGFQVTFSGQVQSPADLGPYAAAGVTRLLVRPWSRSAEAIEGLRAFSRRLMEPACPLRQDSSQRSISRSSRGRLASPSEVS